VRLRKFRARHRRRETRAPKSRAVPVSGRSPCLRDRQQHFLGVIAQSNHRHRLGRWVALAKLYNGRNRITADNMLNYRVLPFFGFIKSFSFLSSFRCENRP
jgi:hypothetical protein